MHYPRTGFDFKIQFQNQEKTNRYNVCVGVNSKKAAAVLILIDLIYYVAGILNDWKDDVGL